MIFSLNLFGVSVLKARVTKRCNFGGENGERSIGKMQQSHEYIISWNTLHWFVYVNMRANNVLLRFLEVLKNGLNAPQKVLHSPPKINYFDIFVLGNTNNTISIHF